MPDNGGVTTGSIIAPIAREQAGASGPSAAARPMTRADVVAMGRGVGGGGGVNGWAYVQVAQAALRVEAGDDEVRFLLAAAYARLGLRTCAAEQIERLSGPARADVSVIALLEVVGKLPDDRVAVAELAEICRGNLDVLATRAGEPVDLRGRFNAWKMVAGTFDWFRASDGNIVRRKRGDLAAWVVWGDHAGAAEGVKVEGAGGVGGVGGPPPTVVEGIDPPALLARVIEQTRPTGNGYLPPVTVVAIDEMAALHGLAQMDLREALAEERVRVVVGEQGVNAWAARLEEQALAGMTVTGPVYTLPDVQAAGLARAETVLTHVSARQTGALQALNAEVRSVYFSRDRERLGKRFAAAMKGEDAPLRVLLPTCRYSTFIQHSAADLAEALRESGCEARVLIEPDPHAQLTNVAYLKALAEFRPDLVVQINYTRANMGGANGVYPPGVVYATWIQDAMPHLFDRRIGAAHTRMDFVAGNLTENLFQNFEYPRARALHAPMAASTRKFHDGPVTTAQRERFACEIAYVSHHSETPEAMLERLVRESAGSPWMGEVARDVFPRVRAILDSPLVPGGATLSAQLRGMTAAAIRAHRIDPSEHALTQILMRCTHPLADRMIRHQTLAWAAEICARRGWRMHLYGRGWEKHPTLAAHARGELAHGDDLRACYQCARAHLQVSAHTVVHQRVFECVLSGGLPLCRLQADDLATMEFSAAADACAHAEPDACDPWTKVERANGRVGYSTVNYDGPRRYRDMLRALGLPEAEFAWINPILVERVRRLGSIEGQEHSPDRLLGDAAACMFHTSEGLEHQLVHAVEDDGARERVRQQILTASGALVTTDGFAHRLLKFITESLSREVEPDRREWFDRVDGVVPPPTAATRC